MVSETALLDPALLRLDDDGPSFNARGCMDPVFFVRATRSREKCDASLHEFFLCRSGCSRAAWPRGHDNQPRSGRCGRLLQDRRRAEGLCRTSRRRLTGSSYRRLLQDSRHSQGLRHAPLADRSHVIRSDRAPDLPGTASIRGTKNAEDPDVNLQTSGVVSPRRSEFSAGLERAPQAFCAV